MSYDLYLKGPACPHCGHSDEIDVEHDNPTYNYSAMIRQADSIAGGDGCSFAAIDHKTGGRAAEWFSKILETLVLHEDVIRPLQPTNGWGTYDHLCEIFQYYKTLSAEHPLCVWTQQGDGSEEMKCCCGWLCGGMRP